MSCRQRLGTALAVMGNYEQEIDMTQDNQPGAEADRIDLADENSIEEWASKLGVTTDQLRDAVRNVGDLAADVEMHLKGSRSTTNAERVDEADGA